MKKLISFFVIFVLSLASSMAIVSAQSAISSGCAEFDGLSGDAFSVGIVGEFFAGEVITLTVNSPNGGTFDFSVGGVVTFGATDGDSFTYTVPADGNVAIEIVTLTGTGTYDIDCEGTEEDPFDGTICHIPQGNPDAAHTITVGSENAVDAHLGHGDTLGACPEGVQTRADLSEANISVFIIYETGTLQLYSGCDNNCEESVNVAITTLIDFELVLNGGEFAEIDNPSDYGFEVEDAGSTYIVLYYLHPNPDDPTVGVFQLNIYENDTLVDDSLLLFIDTDGNIVLWTDQGFWVE